MTPAISIFAEPVLGLLRGPSRVLERFLDSLATRDPGLKP
jgi:hypothetical protein